MNSYLSERQAFCPAPTLAPRLPVSLPIAPEFRGSGLAGVLHAIGLLRDEVDRNLAMLGARACTDLGPGHIVRRRG